MAERVPFSSEKTAIHSVARKPDLTYMGLAKLSDLVTNIGECVYKPAEQCFYCADPLGGDVWIFWNGTDCQIWMHPACAKRLADNLNKDWERFKVVCPELL